MEYIVKRLGRDVSYADALQVPFNDCKAFLGMYGFDEKMPSKKEDRAALVVRCLNSKPDDIFALPSWEEIPAGTMFVCRMGDQQHKDYLFAKVVRNTLRPKQVELEFVETDCSSGFEVVDQTDCDVLFNRGYSVCRDARPSTVSKGVKIFMRVALVRTERTVGWRFIFSGGQMRFATPEKYDPARKYSVYARHNVNKSWIHPWLDREALRISMALERSVHPDYDPRKSNACVEFQRSVFEVKHLACLVDYPVLHGSSNARLEDVLEVMCEHGHLPLASCKAISMTNKALRRIVKPYSRQGQHVCSERRRSTLAGVLPKVLSPRKVFRHHLCSWLHECFSHRAVTRGNGGSVCEYETGFMPYDTPFVMKLVFGYTTEQAMNVRNSRGWTLYTMPMGDGYMLFGVYPKGTGKYPTDALPEHYALMCKRVVNSHINEFPLI